MKRSRLQVQANGQRYTMQVEYSALITTAVYQLTIKNVVHHFKTRNEMNLFEVLAYVVIACTIIAARVGGIYISIVKDCQREEEKYWEE